MRVSVCLLSVDILMTVSGNPVCLLFSWLCVVLAAAWQQGCLPAISIECAGSYLKTKTVCFLPATTMQKYFPLDDILALSISNRDPK